MEFLTSFMGRNGFLPHGYCFTWSAGLLWTMVVSDAAIAAAYFSIPATIVAFIRRRREPGLSHIAWLFSAFIFACGLTHVMDVWTIWQPDYGAQALTKAATAAVSMLTAIVLWRLIPKGLRIPSAAQQRQVIAELQAEVQRRHTAEEQLAEVQQSLAVTLASIGAGFMAIDRMGQVTRMNSVAERVLGWREGEARGHSLWRVFEREGRPAEMLQRNPIDVIREEGLTIDEASHVVALSRAGRRTAVEVKSALTYDPEGQVRGAAIVFRDVSRIMQAEVEASRLAAIVASSNDAIIGKTLDGRITSWNRGAQSMFGYSADEAIGQPVQMLIPPEREAEEMLILNSLAQGASVPNFDTVRRTRDGTLIDVSVSISPIRDAHGRIIGASKIARDVTQQRRAEAALLTANRLEAENRQILEASRLKSQFLANMSHELRTPLNAVIGFADLLHSGRVPAGGTKYHEFLGHIATSGRHLLQLINDVLDLSKVEAGKFDFHPVPVDLPVLLREAANVVQAAAIAKGIEVTHSVEPGLDAIVVDPARLKQALYNYLSNAVKFTRPGGRVQLRATAAGPAHFRVEVADTGIGIASSDLGRLFTDFQQLDAGYARQHAGTGLGLALTRKLVQAQGGSVGVRSTVDVGSVFHLILPRVAGDPAAAVPPPSLLVIEPDGPYSDSLVRGASDAGYMVDTAGTAAQALQIGGGQAFDAITLGLVLPDQRGLAVLATLRAEGPNRGSPVVSMSMPASGDGAGVAGAAGTAGTVDTAGHARFAITDVLAKPLQTEELVAAMARLQPQLSRRPRVLVIDDDPMALDLMAATLAGLGILAARADDGRRALAEIDVHRPDAIILDLMMPGFDGFAVLDALARLPAWRATPVFVWTSMLLTDEEYAVLAHSAQAILSKGGGALDELLERLADSRRARLPARSGA